MPRRAAELNQQSARRSATNVDEGIKQIVIEILGANQSIER
jgi:hypothetical protein